MRILVFLSFFVTVSCSVDHTDEITQINKVLADQENAWNQGDIAGYMAGYLQSDSLRFASGGIVTYGWQITLDRYKEGYPDKATMGTLTFSNIDIELFSADAALVFGKWKLERANDHPWGLFTLVFSKTNEGWKIVHDHTSAAN